MAKNKKKFQNFNLTPLNREPQDRIFHHHRLNKKK